MSVHEVFLGFKKTYDSIRAIHQRTLYC